jgi:hypothetical protein
MSAKQVRRGLRRLAGALALTLAALASGLAPAAAELKLRRGVNIEAWQSWTNRSEFVARQLDLIAFPDWTDKIDGARLRDLRAAGFDFVRLNVDPSPLFWVGEAKAAPLIAGVVAATRRLHAAGFSVVVDLHLLPEMQDRPDGLHDALGTGGRKETLLQRYLALTERFASALADLPADKTALELMNEPDQDWFSHLAATDKWPGQLAALRAAARKAAPKLTLVLTGARSSAVEGLLRLSPAPFADDPNLIWTFHYYEPMAVTHSGQPWETTPARFLTHLPFPAAALDEVDAARRLKAAREAIDETVADPMKRRELREGVDKAMAAYRAARPSAATIKADFEKVSAWAKASGLRPSQILLGEFGVFQEGADPAARLAVLKATREAAEQAGFAWAVYTAGLSKPRTSFGIMESVDPLRVEAGAAEALGLPRR